MNSNIKNYFEQIRRKNNLEKMNRKKLIYKKIPEIQKIEKEMKIISTNLALSAFSMEKDDVQTEELLRLSKEKIKELQIKRAVLLTDNDYPQNFLDTIYDCTNCKDKGFINKKTCECYSKRMIIEGSKRSNLYSQMQTDNFYNFNYKLYSDNELDSSHPLKSMDTPNLREYMKRVVEVLKGFISQKAYVGAYIYGNTGVGKTFLCSSVCRYAIEQGLSSEYYSMNSFINIVSAYKFPNERNSLDIREINQKYRNLFTCDLLILDDLGTEMQSKLVTSELFTVINERMVMKKRTLISSNINPDGIASIYEERIASRILGSYMQFLIAGKDLRQL